MGSVVNRWPYRLGDIIMSIFLNQHNHEGHKNAVDFFCSLMLYRIDLNVLKWLYILIIWTVLKHLFCEISELVWVLVCRRLLWTRSILTPYIIVTSTRLCLFFKSGITSKDARIPFLIVCRAISSRLFVLSGFTWSFLILSCLVYLMCPDMVIHFNIWTGFFFSRFFFVQTKLLTSGDIKMSISLNRHNLEVYYLLQRSMCDVLVVFSRVILSCPVSWGRKWWYSVMILTALKHFRKCWRYCVNYI